MQRKRRRESALSEQIENRDRNKEIESEELIGPDPSKITKEKLIPSGSTLINCACSDSSNGAFAMGSINTLPGKSQAGKTIVALTMLTCCAVDKRFEDYDLIIDDAEQTTSDAGVGINLDDLFFPLVNRLQAPNYDKKTKDPIPSETIQNFKYNVLRFCDNKKPFIYVLDSLDSLTSNEELEREYTAMKKAAIESKDADMLSKVEGSYKAEKAKHIGEVLRMVNGRIKHTSSALFIIQQTRQRFNKMFGQTDWTTAGGDAPFFYSYHQIFFTKIQAIKSEQTMGLKHEIGGLTQASITKNKLTGKKRKDGIVFPIYESYGVDDVGSCIEFLKKTGHWKSDSGGLNAIDFDIKMKQSDLPQWIEKNKLQKDLQNIVGNVWMDIEKAIRIDRKRDF